MGSQMKEWIYLVEHAIDSCEKLNIYRSIQSKLRLKQKQKQKQKQMQKPKPKLKLNYCPEKDGGFFLFYGW